MQASRDCPHCGAAQEISASTAPLTCASCGQPLIDSTLRRGGRIRPTSAIAPPSPPSPDDQKRSSGSTRIPAVIRPGRTRVQPISGSIPPPPPSGATRAIPPPPAVPPRGTSPLASQSGDELDLTMARGRRGGAARAPSSPRISGRTRAVPSPGASSSGDDVDSTMKRGPRGGAQPQPTTPRTRANSGRMRGSGPPTTPATPTPAAVPTGAPADTGISEYEEGDTIEGRFEVFGSAAGGMGRVLFVHDTLWKTDLAVKSLLRHAGDSPEQVAEDERMFLREAMTWLQLGAHPHIVSGYFARQMGGTLRFFMEFVPGGTLRHLLLRKPVLEPADALNYLAQLCEGMRYVHQQTNGRPHRDLKPDNCLIDEATGALKITDFGLLKGESDTEGDDKARAGSAGRALQQGEEAARKLPPDALLSFQWSLSGGGGAMGTPHYMPPEQWADAHRTDAGADIYAAGVILFEMVAGRRPFEVDEAGCRALATHAPDQRASIEQAISSGAIGGRPDPSRAEQMLRWLEMMHTRLPAPDPRELRPDLPPQVAAIIARCLKRRPQDRFKDFAQLGEAVRKAHRQIAKRDPATLAAADEGTLAATNNMALSLVEMGYPDRALAAFEQCLERDRTALVPWLNHRLQMLLHADSSGNPAEAQKVAQASLKLFSGEIEPARGAEIQQRRAQVRHWIGVMQAASQDGAVAFDAPQSLIFLPMISGHELAERSRERDGLLATARQKIDSGEPDAAYRAIRKAQALLPERRREPAVLELVADVSRSGLIVGVNDAWQHGRLKAGTAAVKALVVLDDGRHAVSGDDGGVLRLFSLDPVKQLGEKRLPAVGSITAIARQDDTLLVGCSDGRVWDVRLTAAGNAMAFAPERAETVIEAPAAVRAVATDATGAIYACGDWPGLLVRSASSRPETLDGRDHMLGISVTPDRQWAVGASERSIAEWDLTRGAKTEPHHYKAPGETTSFALTMDGSFAIVGGRDGVCRIFDFKRAQSAGAMRGNSALAALAVTPEGRHVAAADADGFVTLWSLKTRKQQHQLRAKNVQSLAADPRGRFLIGGTTDGAVLVWQIDWEWSFSAEALQSREQINLEASFEFHKQQATRRKRNRLVAAVASGVALLALVVWLVASSMAAHADERDSGWADLTAIVQGATPSRAAGIATQVRAYLERFPEKQSDAAPILTQLERDAALWREADDLRSRGSTADAGSARALLPEIEAFVAAQPDYAERLAGTMAFLNKQIARDDQRARINALPSDVRALFDRTALQDANLADRLLELPADEQALVARLQARQSRRWLELDDAAHELVLALDDNGNGNGSDDRSAFLQLDDAGVAEYAALSVAHRGPWLHLSVAARRAFASLDGTGRTQFLTLPADHRDFATTLTDDWRATFVSLLPPVRVAVMALPRTSQTDFFTLPRPLMEPWLALEPSHRRAWAAWTAESRNAYSQLADAGQRDAYAQLADDDRAFCDSLPGVQRDRFLQLPAATRRQSFQAVPGGGWAIVPPDLAAGFGELPDSQKRAVASLSEAALRVFFELAADQRPVLLTLQPAEMEAALTLADAQQRSTFLSLPAEERAAAALLPAEARPEFLRCSADERARCLALAAAHRSGWLALDRAGRDALDAVTPELRNGWLQLDAAGRRAFMTLPDEQRARWLSMPAGLRAVFASLSEDARLIFLELQPSGRSRAAGLDDASRQTLFELPDGWRSYYLSLPDDRLAELQALRLPAALVPAWLALSLDEQATIRELDSSSLVRECLELDPAERPAWMVLEKRDRTRFTRLDAAYRRACGRACGHPMLRLVRIDDFGRHDLAVFRCITWEAALAANGVAVPDGSKDAPDLEFVLLPGGEYTMGADEPQLRQSRPPHKREIRPFLLARTEVTRRVWNASQGDQRIADLPREPDSDPMQPANGLAWTDSRRFALLFRMDLPSEAQWEYAGRAGSTSNEPVGRIDGIRQTVMMRPPNVPPPPPGRQPPLRPVAGRDASAFGLFDMFGSVDEYCRDIWVPQYDPALHDDSPVLDARNPNNRVTRGGSMLDSAGEICAASRKPMPSDSRQWSAGLRPMIELPPEHERTDPRVGRQRQAQMERPEVPGFSWLREETFEAGTERRTVLIYQWDRLADALRVKSVPADPHPEVEFVLVPGGSFLMGHNPLNRSGIASRELITVAPFLLARTEITEHGFRELAQGMNRMPSPRGADWPDTPRMPQVGVPCKFAIDWCKRNDARLPSEAEWEYACRAGTVTDFAFGDSLDNSMATVAPTAHNWPGQVAFYQPNAFGLFDMHGNVWEYTHDFWSDPRERTGNAEPVVRQGNADCVIRGGFWASGPASATSDVRQRQERNSENHPSVGFRVAVSLPGPAPKHLQVDVVDATFTGQVDHQGIEAITWKSSGVVEWTLDVPEAGGWEIDAVECLDKEMPSRIAQIDLVRLDDEGQPIADSSQRILHPFRAIARNWTDYRVAIFGRAQLEIGRYRLRVSVADDIGDEKPFGNLISLVLRRVRSTDDPPAFENFRYLRQEEFSAGGSTHRVRIYRYEPFAQALGLGNTESAPEAEFVLLPGGEFRMGPENSQQQTRTIGPMLVARTEVTQRLWSLFAPRHDLPGNVSIFGDGNPQCPVDNIKWDQANRFCQALGLRLPSEAEWEYACRAGTTGSTYIGEPIIRSSLDSPMLGEIAWYGGNAVQMNQSRMRAEKERGPREILGDFYTTMPVATRRPNAFGLHDMLGNVGEVCADFFHDRPDGSHSGAEADARQSESHSVRGGAWYSYANDMRASMRYPIPGGFNNRQSNDGQFGFRPVFSAPQK